MKFLSVFLIVASAILINQSNGIILAGGRLGLGLGGLGLGLGRFGLLGPGLGLGLGLGVPPLGLGLVPPFIPPLAVPSVGFGLGFPIFPRFGLGLGLGLGFRRGLIGRRSVDDVVPVVSQNITTCTWRVNSSTIRCDGFESIECPVEARLDIIKDLTVRLPGLSMISAPIKITGQKDVDGISLFSRVTGTSTLIHPMTGKDVLLWIYSSPIVKESGFFVKDAKCYERLDNFFRTVGYDWLRFSFISKA